MSRSNPHEHAPNPAKRWFEWNGEKGTVRYYDRDAKQNVDAGSDFRFVLLDELSCVRGWHDASQSGITSNEVRDTTKEPLVVKAFKHGILAEGLYREIKDRVNAAGGDYHAACYIAFAHGDEIVIGSIRFRGAALNAWVEFKKVHRAELCKNAVAINGYVEGKNGRVTFRVPKLSIVPLTNEENNIAVALDSELQVWLKGYFARNTREQVEQASVAEPLTDNDIPF